MAEKHEIKSNDHEVWYSDNGVVIEERVGCAIVTYDERTGNVDDIVISVPQYGKTEDGKEQFMSYSLSPDTVAFRKAEERVTSKLSKRMEKADWPKLEKSMNASAFRELKERYDTELRKDEEARKKKEAFKEELKKLGLETNSESEENVESAPKKRKREYKYNEFGGIQSESLDGITLEFDEFGKPIGGTIEIPFNPDGNNPGGSGAPILFSCDGNGLSNVSVNLSKNPPLSQRVGKGYDQRLADLFSSSEYKRMHNTDWKKLEKYAKETGREKEFQDAQKRYEEDKPDWIWRVKVNTEEAVENVEETYDKTKEFYNKNIKPGLKEIANDLKQLVSGDEKEQPDSSKENQSLSDGKSGGSESKQPSESDGKSGGSESKQPSESNGNSGGSESKQPSESNDNSGNGGINNTLEKSGDKLVKAYLDELKKYEDQIDKMNDNGKKIVNNNNSGRD